MPLPRWRASSAAMAGIGEALPTAMWRTSPIRRVMTQASNSSSRQAAAVDTSFTKPSSCRAPRQYILIEIAREALGGRGEAGIFAEMAEVGGIMVGQAERPAAVRRHRDRIHIEARQG